MWKINGKPFYNELSHISRENLDFASNLRKDVNFSDNYNNKVETQSEPLKNQSKSSADAIPVKDRLLSRVLCNRSDCVRMGHEIEMALLERDDLIRSIRDGNSYLEHIESDFNIANDECLKTQWRQETLLKTFEALSQEEISLVPKLRQLRDDRLSIEKEVCRMKRVLEDLQAKMQIRSSSHNMPRINFYPNKVIDDLRKKHSGIFEMTAGGRRRWSCCLSENPSEQGCLDDSSVEAKALLGDADLRWKASAQRGMLSPSLSIHERRPASAGAVRAVSIATNSGNMFEKSPSQRQPFRSVVKPQQNHFLLSSGAMHSWVKGDHGNKKSPRRSPSPSTSTSPTPATSRHATAERHFYRRTVPEAVQSTPSMTLVSPSGRIKLGEIREEPKRLLSATNRRMTTSEVYLQEFRP